MKRKAYEERRKYLRGDLYYLLRYTVEGCTEEGELLVSSINISGGGLLIRSPQPLKANDRLTIKLNFLGPPNRHIDIKARVVRARKRKKYWAIALEFVSISEKEKAAIVYLINILFKGKHGPKRTL